MTDPIDLDPMPADPPTGHVLDDLSISVAPPDEGPGQAPTEAPGAPTDPDPEVQPAAVMADSGPPIADATEVATEATPPEPPPAPIADAAALAESEAAAAARASTAAEVAIVAATASARADEVAAAARAAQAATEVEAPLAHPRRRALRAASAMLVRGLLTLALFVGGIALGNAAFLRSDQNATATAPVLDPSIDESQPPAIVQEFITALASGDADSIRSSLRAESHARLTGEFRRFGIQSIIAVDTLGTHVDGPRSATEVVMQGTTTTGAPISINLIILTDGNTIEGFR